MDYMKLGTVILEKCGGPGNIRRLTHCATRLRFEFNDKDQVKHEDLKRLDGVISVVDKGGQYQVIIGNDVQKCYRAIVRELEKAGVTATDAKLDKKEKGSLIDRLISTMSTTFTPMIPALIGGGMVKAVLAVLTILNLLDDSSQTYYILNLISDSAFYFMPVLLAYGAAVKFECSVTLAITIAGVLLHPSWNALVAAGESVRFFGVPVTLAEYGSTVLPIIFTVWLMSYIERFADRVSPSVVKFFTKPLLTVLLTAPLALIVIGPIGTYLNDLVALGAEFINSRASWLIPCLMGVLQPLLLLSGTAWAMTPIATVQLAERGSEIINGPGMLASNIAHGGATLAVGFKTKNRELKQLANSAGVTGVIGIVEPALYGVMLRLKTPLIAAMIGGGVGGFYAGMVGMVRYAFVSPGLAGLPAFIGENPMNIVHALITCVIAFAVSFAAVLIIGFKDDEATVETAKTEAGAAQETAQTIISPVAGKVIPLSEVNDDVFSGGILGKGAAVIPEDGKVIAPIDGEIMVFDTKHAIGITGSNGVEIMIHVGMDTVNLEGQYFETEYKTGDIVKAGDKVLKFDKDKLIELNYDIVTPVIITNSDSFSVVEQTDADHVNRKEPLLFLKK